MDLPISSKYRSTPNEPVSEAERNQLSAQLNTAFEEGRFDQVTYAQLLDQVFGAQRLGDLLPVVEVLGKPATHNVPAIVEEASGGRPGELTEAHRPGARGVALLVGGMGVLAILAVILLLIVLF